MRAKFSTVPFAIAFLCAAGSTRVPAQQVGSSVAIAQQQLPDTLFERGKAIFNQRGCVSCHSIGKGVIAAPDLAGVANRRSREWLVSWLRDPEPMLDTDKAAIKMMKSFNGMRMPNLRLTDEEINAVITYMELVPTK
jgi:protein SCO1